MAKTAIFFLAFWLGSASTSGAIWLVVKIRLRKAEKELERDYDAAGTPLDQRIPPLNKRKTKAPIKYPPAKGLGRWLN